jgi:hypothetical protein
VPLVTRVGSVRCASVTSRSRVSNPSAARSSSSKEAMNPPYSRGQSWPSAGRTVHPMVRSKPGRRPAPRRPSIVPSPPVVTQTQGGYGPAKTGKGVEMTARSLGLACVAEVETFRAKVGGSASPASVRLRVTSVHRQEDGIWRLVHRHADPITTPQAADSVISG